MYIVLHTSNFFRLLYLWANFHCPPPFSFLPPPLLNSKFPTAAGVCHFDNIVMTVGNFPRFFAFEAIAEIHAFNAIVKCTVYSLCQSDEEIDNNVEIKAHQEAASTNLTAIILPARTSQCNCSGRRHYTLPC